MDRRGVHGVVAVAKALILGAALAALALPLGAQVVKRGDSKLEKLTFSKKELRVSQTLADSEAVRENSGYRADLARFRSQYGAAWHFLIDKRTGHLNLVSGGAIPFIPGPANQLRWQDFGVSGCQSPSCVPRQKMESLARDFLARNRGVFAIDPEELVLDPLGASPVGSSMYLLRFQWTRGGVPVEGGSVFFAVNNGNLVQIGLANIGSIGVDPKPGISVEKAWEVVRSYVGGMTAKDQVVNKGTLSILPITPKGLDPDGDKVPFGRMIDYVLVYKLAFRRPGVLGTWEATVDAHTGELLRFQDANVYGHVQGGVYKTDAPQVEVSEPFPTADYGAALFADGSGNFPATSGTSTLTGLTLGGMGVAGGVKIISSCGAISLASTGTGLIDFGSGAGTDCTTPGVGGAGNTHAARTQYWNVSEIKRKGIGYLPTNTWLQGQLPDNVDIVDSCNAYWWLGTVNFFTTGTLPQGPTNFFGPFDQTCGNTGELPGVSLHEWGHGMDENDGSGAGLNSPGEARADWTAVLQTHQSCVGGGFFTARSPMPAYGLNCGGYGNPCTSCTGIREIDYALHSTPTPWTPQNFSTVWGPGFMDVCNFGGGPCDWEPHCEAGIATQALWDLVNRDLVGAPTSLDINTAWQLADRLFYTGMPQSTSMYTCSGPPTMKTSNGCGAGSLYTVMRAIDDDGDGVANGTPHAAAIFAALNRHGIACGGAADAANQNQTSCPSLTTPTVTATADSHTVHLSWTTGGVSATRYFVLRNETGCNAGFTRIATVSAPTLVYDDSTVVHGLTYYYRIQAATANDSCVSAMSGCATVAASLPADQDFYVRDWTTSMVADNGAEPSTNSVFWYTSDVWNRGTNSAGSPNASGWYDTDNMFAGLGALGNNYAFVRVHRNTSGSAATVKAHFLVSPFGTGSSFVDADLAPDPTISFGAADTVQVLASGYFWHQDPVASTHACLAVQIYGFPSGDPFQLPGLNGRTPGPDDYVVINDNNKAQRNLDVSLNVPHFAGLGFALVHNAALVPRDVVLRYGSPEAERLQGAQIGIVGGQTLNFRSGGTLTLPGMQPGENRWISLKYQVADNKPVPIDFTELDRGNAVNGFTILARPAPLADVIADDLRNHVQVFNRLAAAFGVSGGKAEAEAAASLLQVRRITTARYLAFLKQHVLPMTAVVQPLAARGGRDDAFGALAALRKLGTAAGQGQAEQAASEHGMLLRRLDSLATMLQKAQGDPADVLQMVRWQESLYRTQPVLQRLDCSAPVVKASQEFIGTYSRRRQQVYPALLRELSACFHQTAKRMGSYKLEQAAAALDRPNLSLAALEKAHREYLLALQEATGTGS
ncbi:MAG TPA: hypothetical protein VH394_01165 [Thermoanaerobaculia bacterium]|nr:hypothetical protein [Thermoanaerobaculia bacterium]